MLEFLGKWMPPNGSAHGPQIDQLIGLMHWLMAVLFVGWALYFIYVLFRFRASKNPQASYEGSRSHFSSYIEIGVVVIEAVLLIGFAIPAWAKWVAPHEDEVNTFGGGEPIGVFLSSLLFGFVDTIGWRLQGERIMPVYFISMLPYVATLLALTAFTLRKERARKAALANSNDGEEQDTD